MSTETAFDIAFAATVSHEGTALDLTYGDRGNWTGGEVGKGELRGSKFGISAAAYPTLDIAALTIADAEAIYQRDYWAPIQGDALPGPLAVMVFDAAVNEGPTEAAILLQRAARVTQDGVIGPVTLDAVTQLAAQGLPDLCIEFLARRIVAMTEAPEWKTDALGWSRRLAAQPYDAMGAAT